MFDVGICIDSGYAVLGPKDDETGLHSIGYRIEDTDAVVEAGRALGKEGSYPLCDTCTNTDDDGPLDNYKATVKGVVSELGDGTAGEPTGAPLISNVQMLDESVGCPEPTPAPQSDEPTSKPTRFPTRPPTSPPITESPTKAPITLPPIPPFLPPPTSDAPITSQPTISKPATDAPIITTSQPTVMTTDEPTQPPVAKQTDSPIEDVTTTTTEATVIAEEETTTTTTDATSTAGIEEEEMEEPTMNDPTPAPTEWWQKDDGTDPSNSENSSAQVLCLSFSLSLGALAVMYFHL